MPFPLLLYSKPLCMFKTYKILLGKYKRKTFFSFLLFGLATQLITKISSAPGQILLACATAGKRCPTDDATLEEVKVQAGCAGRAWGRALILPPFSEELQALCRVELCSSDAAQELQTSSTPKAGRDNPRKVLSPVLTLSGDCWGYLGRVSCCAGVWGRCRSWSKQQGCPGGSHWPPVVPTHSAPAFPACPTPRASLPTSTAAASHVTCLGHIYLLPKDAVRVNNFFKQHFESLRLLLAVSIIHKIILQWKLICFFFPRLSLPFLVLTEIWLPNLPM